MAFTKIVGAGIHTLSNVNTHNINSSGIITATKFVGPFDGSSGDFSGDVTIDGNLVVNGDTTTLNTTLREVELLRVDANSSVTAGIITQSGSGYGLYVDGVTVFGNTQLLPSFGAGTKAVVADLAGNGNWVDFSILGGRSGRSIINFGDHDDQNVGAIKYYHTDDSLNFFTNGDNERLRITSTGITSITGADDQDNFIVNVSGTQFAVHQDDSDGEVSLRAQDGSGSNNAKYMTFFTQASGSAAAERLRIEESGNIGIGTTNPQTKLHIVSNNPVIRLTDGNQAADNRNWNIGAGVTNILRIQAIKDDNSGGGSLFDFYRSGNQVTEFRGVKSANTWFVISNEDQKVGIGTTDPDEALQVFGGIVAGNATSGTYQSGFSILKPNDSQPRTFAIVDDDNDLKIGGGAWNNIKMHTAPQGSGTRVAITSTGDLIHTSTDKTLSLVTTRNVSEAGAKIAFFGANRYDTDEEFAAIKGQLVNNQTGSGNKQRGNLLFTVGNNSHQHIMTDGGQVGIGTDSPSEKLTVLGNVLVKQLAGTNAKLELQETSTTNPLRISQTATEARIQNIANQPLNIRSQGGSGSNGYLAFWTRDSERLRISQTGKVGIGTTVPESLLHLKGAGSSSSGIRFDNSYDTVFQYFTNDANDSDFLITYNGTGGAELTIHADGNLGLNESNGDDVLIGTSSVIDNSKLTIVKAAVGLTTAIALGNGNASGTGSKIISTKSLVLSADYDANNGSDKSYLGFETDGTERLRIGSTGISTFHGNVNIDGDSASKACLDVDNQEDLGNTKNDVQEILNLRGDIANNGQLRFKQVRFSNGNSWETSAFRIQRVVDVTNMGYIDFGTGSGAKGRDILFSNGAGKVYMNLSSEFNMVGINTTNPESRLTVAGTSATAQIEIKRLNTNATGTVGALNYTALDGHSVANISAVADGDDEGAHLVFRTTSDATENSPFGGGTLERLRILSDGKVGIGSDNPHRTLVLKTGDGDIHCLDGNGGIYMGTDNTGGFQKNCAIARAGAENYHIAGSTAGDLCIAGESGQSMIFGVSPFAGGMNTFLHVSRLRNFNFYGTDYKFHTGSDEQLSITSGVVQLNAANNTRIRGGVYAKYTGASGNSANINTASAGKVSWLKTSGTTTIFENGGFTNTATDVTVPFDGIYQVTFNGFLSGTGGGQRTNVRFRYRINGTDSDVDQSLNNYIRTYSGHDESSVNFTAYLNLSSGDTVAVSAIAETNVTHDVVLVKDKSSLFFHLVA